MNEKENFGIRICDTGLYSYNGQFDTKLTAEDVILADSKALIKSKALLALVGQRKELHSESSFGKRAPYIQCISCIGTERSLALRNYR